MMSAKVETLLPSAKKKRYCPDWCAHVPWVMLPATLVISWLSVYGINYIYMDSDFYATPSEGRFAAVIEVMKDQESIHFYMERRESILATCVLFFCALKRYLAASYTTSKEKEALGFDLEMIVSKKTKVKKWCAAQIFSKPLLIAQGLLLALLTVYYVNEFYDRKQAVMKLNQPEGSLQSLDQFYFQELSSEALSYLLSTLAPLVLMSASDFLLAYQLINKKKGCRNCNIDLRHVVILVASLIMVVVAVSLCVSRIETMRPEAQEGETQGLIIAWQSFKKYEPYFDLMEDVSLWVTLLFALDLNVLHADRPLRGSNFNFFTEHDNLSDMEEDFNLQSGAL